MAFIQSNFNLQTKSFDEVVIDLNLPVCGETFRRILQKRGFANYKAQIKPPLDDKPENREKHIAGG